MMGFIVDLPQKGTLRLSGEDRHTFLQGLITQDIQSITPQTILYSLFLSPQGRYRYDFFVFENPRAQSLDLMLDAVLIPGLMQQLTPYRLRSKVNLEDVTPYYQTVALLEASGETFDIKTCPLPVSPGELHYLTATGLGGFIFKDPRCSALGWQALLPRDTNASPQNDLETAFNMSLKKGSLEDYDTHRISLSIPNHQDLIPDKSIPLECGFREMGAISWEKGCYLGQELTARTYHQGTVRKRILSLEGGGDVPPWGTKLVYEGGTAGEIRSGVSLPGSRNRCLGLIRLEAFFNAEKEKEPFLLEGTQAPYTPYRATWMDLIAGPL